MFHQFQLDFPTEMLLKILWKSQEIPVLQGLPPVNQGVGIDDPPSFKGFKLFHGFSPGGFRFQRGEIEPVYISDLRENSGNPIKCPDLEPVIRYIFPTK